ncbi:hypothetical protein MLGJGCBP_03153 [Rhodococcus sp. T7]|nr:hypothetical protein MLGJGCBP_03153 [Rhodococcus sp. T7]
MQRKPVRTLKGSRTDLDKVATSCDIIECTAPWDWRSRPA